MLSLLGDLSLQHMVSAESLRDWQAAAASAGSGGPRSTHKPILRQLTELWRAGPLPLHSSFGQESRGCKNPLKTRFKTYTVPLSLQLQLICLSEWVTTRRPTIEERELKTRRDGVLQAKEGCGSVAVTKEQMNLYFPHQLESCSRG